MTFAALGYGDVTPSTTPEILYTILYGEHASSLAGWQHSCKESNWTFLQRFCFMPGVVGRQQQGCGHTGHTSQLLLLVLLGQQLDQR